MKKSVFILGLTGPSGAGKSLLGSFLGEKGYFVIDADQVYKEMTMKPGICLDLLQNEFGTVILQKNGSLDRKKLAEIVFSDAQKLIRLNQITHPLIKEKINKIISEKISAGKTRIIVDASVLIESGANRICNMTVAVLAAENNRIGRIRDRDLLSEAAAKSRINAQQKDEFYRANSDITIYNDGDTEDLYRQAENLLNLIEDKIQC